MSFIVKISKNVSNSSKEATRRLAGKIMLTTPDSFNFAPKSPIVMAELFHSEYPITTTLPIKVLNGQDSCASELMIKEAKMIKTPKDLESFKNKWNNIHSALSAFPV